MTQKTGSAIDLFQVRLQSSIRSEPGSVVRGDRSTTRWPRAARRWSTTGSRRHGRSRRRRWRTLRIPAAAHEFAGEVLFRRGQFTQADAEFKNAVELEPRLALAWWGLGRVAECASMNKTAVEDFRRAYELNPKDPRILSAWIPQLRGQERAKALQTYLAAMGATPETEDLRQRMELAKALDGRRGHGAR